MALTETETDKFDCPGFAALGLSIPSPREYAEALRKHWTAKSEALVEKATAPLLERIAALEAQVEHNHSEQHLGMVEQAAQPVAEVFAVFNPLTERWMVDVRLTPLEHRAQRLLAGTLLYTSPPKAAPLTDERQEPKLDKPARVGNGTFGVGVSSRLVVEAAQRHHEYHLQQQAMTPEQQAEQDRRDAAFKDLIDHGITPATVEKEGE